ncbi:hypothetical protein pb186bvf_007965 [Paramecium bursaria]
MKKFTFYLFQLEQLVCYTQQQSNYKSIINRSSIILIYWIWLGTIVKENKANGFFNYSLEIILHYFQAEQLANLYAIISFESSKNLLIVQLTSQYNLYLLRLVYNRNLIQTTLKFDNSKLGIHLYNSFSN